MKNLLFTLFLACSLFLFKVGFSQSFNIDLRNFEQVNETEFTFEAYIQNESGVPFTLFAYQFQLEFDADIRNGGIFDNNNLTVEGESELTGVNQPLSTGFTVVAAGRLQFASEQYLGTNVEATYLDDATEYKIDKFRVKLSKDGSPHLFADMAPDWKFNLTGTSVTKADDVDVNNTTITGPNFTLVTRNKPATAYDHNLGDRQMAGYCFTGNGDWDNTSNWNNVTVVNANTLPGLNSNAIINGNLTLSAATDATSVFSLEPDGNGNGGELTLKTGEEPLYLITIESTNDAYSVAISDENGAPNWLLTPGVSGRSLSLAAGTNVKLYTSDPNFVGGSFIQWVDDDGTIGSVAAGQDYSIPAKAITITAQWNPSGKGEPIIPVDYKSRSGNDLFASIIINPGAALIVDQLYNDNENGAEAILVKSDATGTGYLIHNNSGVLATVERYLAGSIYHYVSSPIADGTHSILIGTNGTDDFWEWNEVLNLWNNLNFNGGNPSALLNPAKGYAVAYATPDQTKSFAGTINTGEITFDATYTNEWMQRGYNFIGNPYPTAIGADLFIDENAALLEDIGGGLYFWDEAANYNGIRWDYSTYTKLGATIPRPEAAGGSVLNGFIAPGQGFMINVSEAGTIKFNNSMRVTDEADFFKEGDEKCRIWLSVTGPEGDYNEILVGFFDEGQEGVDLSDGLKLKGNSELAFYMLLEGNDYVIQGLPEFDMSKAYTIPLGIDAGIAGAYTFSIRKMENFDPSVKFVLEDNLNGSFNELDENQQYVAEISDQGEIRSRFILHINGVTSVPEANEIDESLIYSANQQIIVENLNGRNILEVEVFNSLGQQIERVSTNSTVVRIDVPGNQKIFIVKLRTEKGIESHKLLVY